MSIPVSDSASATLDPAGGAGVPTTLGGSLRALRQTRGWSLEEVSSRIKFAPRQIDALENERWDELPTGVSLRGLARNYARLLGADDAAIVASLAAHTGESRGLVNEAPRAPLQGRAAMPTDEESGSGMPWGWLFILLVVVLAGVTYAFWQGWLPADWLPAGWIPRNTP